jgi:TonB family protein
LFEFTIPAGTVPQSPRPLVASVVAHGLAFLLLFALRFSSGVLISHPAPQHVTLLAPVNFPARAKAMPVLPPKAIAPRPNEFHPPPPATAHLQIPVPIIAAPAIEIPKPILPEIPKIPVTVAAIKASSFSEVKPVALPPAPKPVVRASGFQNSESTVTRPANGPVATAGAFDSSASAEAAPVRKTIGISRSGGFSEASAASSSVASRGSIQSGTFGDTTVEKGAAPSQRSAAAATTTPVEILSKPKPAYTDDARRKNIEGEVLLEMQFSASGEARVLRVVRGIGHGLDETAVAAARGIRFRPATRDGGAVDSAAIVRILFQLAN